ncbi:hypothetical protein ACWGBV_09325 [Streptomyces sp. NPDC055051]
MRHHETPERTTQAPGRRHHADPTDEYHEPSQGRPEPRTGPDGSGSGRPGPAPTGGDTKRAPDHSPTVAPTPPRQPGADEADDRRQAAPQAPSSAPPAPSGPTTRSEGQGSPTVAPTPQDTRHGHEQGEPRRDQPRSGGAPYEQPRPGGQQSDPSRSGRPAHDEARTSAADGATPAAPQVPAQRTPRDYPPPMPSAPPGQAPAAHTGHARHAAPAPQDRAQGADRGTGAEADGIPDLLGPAEEGEFIRRWHEVQGRFVDDPRQAVHSADALVGDVMKTLTDTFARHRQNLEGQWSQGLEADTESLRLALCQYRALFQRLLST